MGRFQPKLTNAQVAAARELRHDYQMTVRELAAMYRVGRSTMSYALLGITYKDAGGPVDAGRTPPGTREERPPTRRLMGAGERNELRHMLQQLSEDARAARNAVEPETGVRGLTVDKWRAQWKSMKKDIDWWTKRLDSSQPLE